MSDDATRLNASLEERLALIKSYPEFFVWPPSMENIHIPQAGHLWFVWP